MPTPQPVPDARFDREALVLSLVLLGPTEKRVAELRECLAPRSGASASL